MNNSVFIVIVLLVVFWYGLVPFVGALFNRHKWNQFRRRFDELRLRPILDYRIYRQLKAEDTVFRFIGGFESITDRKTLWIQGENLTIPVSLADANIYLLPIQKGEGVPAAFDPGEELPERINWSRVTTLAEGARVYVGGALVFREGRWIFVSSKEKPLTVIFFDGPDRSLTTRTISAGRHRNEYWNEVTPYSLAMGAVCQILIALSYLHRPSFRPMVITSIIAMFIPLFPMIPPGILFTTIFMRLSWQARKFMAYSDLARLPLRYLTPQPDSGWQGCQLPDGEAYGMIRRDSPPEITQEGNVPLIIPGVIKSRNKAWYVCGALRGDDELPVEPADPFATFGVLPGKPDLLSIRYKIASHTLDIVSWIILLMGIGLNIYFIRLILTLL